MIKVSKNKGKNILRLQELLYNLNESNDIIFNHCSEWIESEDDIFYDIKYILREMELIYRNLTNCKLIRNISEEESKRRAENMRKNRFNRSK